MHRRHKSLTATLSTENDHIRTRASKARKIFIKKSAKKILWVQGKYVTLQRFRRETGRLAQLVQSVCLTSRGSGVRIPQRPPQTPSVTLTRSPRFFISGCDQPSARRRQKRGVPDAAKNAQQKKTVATEIAIVKAVVPKIATQKQLSQRYKEKEASLHFSTNAKKAQQKIS